MHLCIHTYIHTSKLISNHAPRDLKWPAGGDEGEAEKLIFLILMIIKLTSPTESQKISRTVQRFSWTFWSFLIISNCSSFTCPPVRSSWCGYGRMVWYCTDVSPFPISSPSILVSRLSWETRGAGVWARPKKVCTYAGLAGWQVRNVKGN